MPGTGRLVVFDAHTIRGFIIAGPTSISAEADAIRAVVRSKILRMLLTDGIIDQYQKTSDKVPQFQLQPALNDIARNTNAILLGEYHLDRITLNLSGFPREHRAYLRDSIGAQAEYFVTSNNLWLRMSPETSERYGLFIITPEHFLEIEG